MADCDQAFTRKRTLSNPSLSSQIYAKYPKTAATCSSPTSHPVYNSSSNNTNSNSNSSGSRGVSQRSESHPLSPRDRRSEAHRCDSSSPFPTLCDPSSPSSDSTPRSSSNPFPRYSLGIPHLDVLLPFRDGLDLLHAYHQGIAWIYTPVDRTTLLETLEEAERHGADSIHPHRLACLLAALALGDLFSSCFPSIPSCPTSAGLADKPNKRGRIWFGVASACLAGSNNNVELMHHPTPDACSALYLMSTYLLCSDDEELFHRSRGLTGLALILAKSALFPLCVEATQDPSRCQMAAPSVASQHQAAADLACAATSSASLSSPTMSRTAAITDQDRLHCNRLLSDLIFHLRCQLLTFSQPCNVTQSSSPHGGPSLATFADVPTIQAIWSTFGTPLYTCLDAFGHRYSPNVFHNWKLGLADLMQQVSILTQQPMSLDSRSQCTQNPDHLDATLLDNKAIHPSREKRRITLPDHADVVKLDERIRRYHASLPDFLLLHKPLPLEMAGKVDEDELAHIICQRHMACSMVHRMLMALHRPWFLSALAGRPRAFRVNTKPQGPACHAHDSTAASPTLESDRNSSEAKVADDASGQHQSPSAMFSLSAVLRSATWQTETYASATACAPPQALAWWQLTNNALAAAIVQATALLRLSCPLKNNDSVAPQHSPRAQQIGTASPFHTQIRSDLDKNVCSFQNVANRCKLAAKALPFLHRVSSAIDLGICKSRSTAASNPDALQTSIAQREADETRSRPSPSPTPSRSPSSSYSSSSASFIDHSAPTRPNNGSAPFKCNNNRLVISNSNSNSISNKNLDNRNSNSTNSNHQINTSSNITDTSTNADSSIDKDDEMAYPLDSVVSGATDRLQASARIGSTTFKDRQQPRQGTEARRASSAKSELEAVFGPIASGLELSGTSTPRRSVKPLYRQSWEPIPVTSTVIREADEKGFQLPSSDDAGSSSSSSATCPQTPRSTTLHLNGGSQTQQESTTTNESESRKSKLASHRLGESRKKSSPASDVVLECIRFWQPDMLALASPDDT